MPLTKEKRLRLGGFELAIATDAGRAERIRNSLPYRFVLRPALGLIQRQNDRPRTAAEPPQASPAPQPDTDPEAAAIRERVSKVRWYHTIDLGRGVVTPGLVDGRSIVSRCGLPANLSGKRVLDVGTCDGFWAFEMERRGAQEVVAIDLDSLADYDVPRLKREQIIQEGPERLAGLGLQPVGDGFNLAKDILRSRVRREIVNVYDLSPEKVGMFDIVFCGFLLVHLRDPQTALENIFSVTREFAILAEPIDSDLEAFTRPTSSFLGTSFMGMWWGHNSKSLKKMMQTAGFEPTEEVSRAELDFRTVSLTTVVLKGYVGPPAGRVA